MGGMNPLPVDALELELALEELALEFAELVDTCEDDVAVFALVDVTELMLVELAAPPTDDVTPVVSELDPLVVASAPPAPVDSPFEHATRQRSAAPRNSTRR
jgi:hypothetical protein